MTLLYSASKLFSVSFSIVRSASLAVMTPFRVLPRSSSSNHVWGVK